MEDISYFDSYKHSENKDNLLVEKGFFNSWLFLYLNKIFQRDKNNQLDFNKLYKMDANLDTKILV